MSKISLSQFAVVVLLLALSGCAQPMVFSSAKKMDIKRIKAPKAIRSDKATLLQPLMDFTAYQPLVLPDVSTVAVQEDAFSNCELAYLPEIETPEVEPFRMLRDNISEFAKKFIGVRYRSGGYSEKGFDCSGFTSYVMSNFGIDIPRDSRSQAHIGDQIDLANVKKGDLLFFGYKKGKRFLINHAGLVISDPGEEVKMIHASRRGIVIDSINSSAWRTYYGKRFLFARSFIGKDDYVGKENINDDAK